MNTNCKSKQVNEYYDIHVTEDESRKPKAKLESKKSSKAPITKSTEEKRLIQHGIKKHLRGFLNIFKKAQFRNNFWGKKL